MTKITVLAWNDVATVNLRRLFIMLAPLPTVFEKVRVF